MSRRAVVLGLMCMAVLLGGTSLIVASNVGVKNDTVEELRGADLPTSLGSRPKAVLVDGDVLFPGTAAPAYRVDQAKVTTDYVAELGGRLGIKASPESIDKVDMFSMSDETRSLEVFPKSGGIVYSVEGKRSPVVEREPVLPSKAEAKQRAIDFLKATGLWEDDITSVEVRDGSSQGRVTVNEDGSETSELWVIERHVVFSRVIEGKPVEGVGEKFTVFVGEDGISGVIKCWRPISPYRVVQLEPLADALLAAKRTHARQLSILDCPGGTDTAIVTKATISYVMSSIFEDQEYVVPVYELTGVCLDENGKELGEFRGWCDAGCKVS